VLCYRIASSAGEKFSLDLKYERVDNHTAKREAEYNAILGQKVSVRNEGHSIVLDGQAIDGSHHNYGEGGESVRFGGIVTVETDGAVIARDGVLTVTNAAEVVVYASFETDYDVSAFAFDRSKDYLAVIRDRLAIACQAGFEEVRAAHVRDHGAVFGNVALQVEGPDYSNLPTDQRLKRIQKGASDDLDFYTLYFQYGRYLLLSSSGGNAVLLCVRQPYT